VIATTSEEVVANWNALKRAERGDASVFADIPSALPALQFADALLRKAEGYGVSPSALVPTFTTIANRLARDSAMAPAEVAGELGAYLVQWARAQGVDAESALRSWNDATRAELTAFAESLGSDIDPADVAARWHRQSK
jgi:uncharacterized protein YabN with tetrapyrrole methylase and pyrophosphatase domain